MIELPPSKYGCSVAAVCSCILIICVVLEDNQAWGQQMGPLPPSSSFLQQASAIQYVAANNPTANNDAADNDAADILSLADESLESLLRHHRHN